MDWLLERMRRDGVRFSHQAVGRLSGFCFSRGQPQVAFQLFKASGGGGAGVVGWVGWVRWGSDQHSTAQRGDALWGGHPHQPPAPATWPASWAGRRRATARHACRRAAACLQTVREMGLLSLEEPPPKAAPSGGGQSEGEEEAAAAAPDAPPPAGGLAGASLDLAASADDDADLEGEGGGGGGGGRAAQAAQAERAWEKARAQAANSYCRMIAACHKARWAPGPGLPSNPSHPPPPCSPSPGTQAPSCPGLRTRQGPPRARHPTPPHRRRHRVSSARPRPARPQAA